MIEEAMEFFWFPEELRKMIMKYRNIFQMRLSTGNFTADCKGWKWESLLEVQFPTFNEDDVGITRRKGDVDETNIESIRGQY